MLECLLGKVKKVGECWEWQGAKNQNGYGLLKIAGKMVMAHRLAYTLKNGEITRWPHGLPLV